jgi:CRP-like cAMP-binding protein
MSKTSALRAPPTNRLLAALPKNEYRRLLPDLEEFPLVFGKLIYRPGTVVHHVYFPTSGIVSLLADVDGGGTLEVGIVGREGMVGMSVFMGVKTSPNRVLVQGAGSALRMKATTLRSVTEKDDSLSRLLRRYSYSLWAQLSQSSACNLYHPIDSRLARWLMMTRDRMEANEFPITQEFLSSMLGVRREGVNKAAGKLQQQSLISYTRGTLTVLKPADLAAVACKCYRIIKKEYDSALNV